MDTDCKSQTVRQTELLGDQPSDYSAEYIAHTTAGHAGIAGVAEFKRAFLIRIGTDQAAGTFQKHCATPASL